MPCTCVHRVQVGTRERLHPHGTPGTVRQREATRLLPPTRAENNQEEDMTMRAILLALTAAALFVVCGCQQNNLACGRCGVPSHTGTAAMPSPVGQLPHGYMQGGGPTGPPTPTYAYPYYTTRAPRDFLMDNPPNIGR